MPSPPAPNSTHENCLNAIVGIIQGIGLYEIPAENIGTQDVVSDVGQISSTLGTVKITGDNGNLAGSFVSVSPWLAEDMLDFTNALDRTNYKCLIAIMTERDTPSRARRLEWRELIRRHLRNLRIGVTPINKCSLEMNPVIDQRLYIQKQIYFSSMVLVCEATETRL